MNNLKFVLKNAIKNKGITSLNILGLTAGFFCSIFLISWVIHESTYDSFVKEKEKIYRVVLDGVINGEAALAATSVSGIGPESKNLFPEVENYVRLNHSFNNSLIKSTDQNYFRANGFAADSTFFDFFSFRALAGDLTTALNVKNNIVIDKQLASNFFGDEPAIGKQLFISERCLPFQLLLMISLQIHTYNSNF